MFEGQYTLYVVSAFGATAVILAGLILATFAASRRAKRELEMLEAARRGASQGEPTARADLAGETA